MAIMTYMSTCFNSKISLTDIDVHTVMLLLKEYAEGGS